MGSSILNGQLWFRSQGVSLHKQARAFRSLKFAEFQAKDGNQGVVSEGTTLFSGCQACRVEHVERLADGTRVLHAVTAEPLQRRARRARCCPPRAHRTREGRRAPPAGAALRDGRQCFAAGRTDDAVGYAETGLVAIESGRFDQVPHTFEASLSGPYITIGPPER
jgi:hypothetical protein